MLALLALVASVLIWAAPTQAQGSNQSPVAIALTPSVSTDGNTMTLNGSLSFDPDDGDTSGSCVGCTFKWEVVTSTWKFLEGFADSTNTLTSATASIDITNVDLPGLVPSNGAIIEFKLTVTDAKSASDSANVSYNIMTNDTPTADISLTAMLADPNAAADATTAEKYSIDAVIDGPGENGNADNEWDIMEGALLVLDGSGSSDPDDDDLNYLWSLVFESGSDTTTIGYPTNEEGASSASTLESTGTAAKLSTDGSVPGTPDANMTVGRLNVARAATAVSQSPYNVIYTLAVTDAGAAVTADNTDSTALVRIVIHDQPADPEITAVNIDAVPRDPQTLTDGIDTAFPPGDKYFVHESDADRDITLTPITYDADQDVNGDGDNHVFDATTGASTGADTGETPPTVTWSEDDADTGTDGQQLRIPANTKAGASFTITASIPRTDVSRTLTFEVIEAQQRPVATILTPNSDVDSNPATPNVATVTPKNGVYTLNGFGFDPDGGSTTSIWAQIDANGAVDPSADNYIPLTGAFSNAVSFSAPDDEDITNILLAFNAVDDEGTFDTKVVMVLFDRTQASVTPSANAGADQVVAPESTVTLAGSAPGVTFGTATAAGNYAWTITGLSSSPDPRSLNKAQSDAVHKSLSAFFADLFPAGSPNGIFDLPDDDTSTTDDRLVNSADTNWPLTAVAIPGATGSAAGLGQFQYFTAPKLAPGLDYVQITFTLAVDDGGDAANNVDHSDTVTITVADAYFSSYIDNPGYCEDRSLGGAQTYPHDSNGDGVADVCSLASTRREAVARQNALQQLASLGLTVDVTDTAGTPRTSGATLTELVLGRTGADEDTTTTPTTPAVSTVVGTCSQAKALTDKPNDPDACDDDATALTPPPSPVDPADAAMFYSGVITGPEFCTNHSLGGARQYAHDLDDDGVADICSLHTTRREAIAVQLALVKFADHSQFPTALAAACTALGSETFGESAAALAADACSVGLMPQRPGSGNSLPG